MQPPCFTAIAIVRLEARHVSDVSHAVLCAAVLCTTQASLLRTPCTVSSPAGDMYIIGPCVELQSLLDFCPLESEWGYSVVAGPGPGAGKWVEADTTATALINSLTWHWGRC